MPIIDFYERSGSSSSVDGAGESDEVFERLVKEIDARASTPYAAVTP